MVGRSQVASSGGSGFKSSIVDRHAGGGRAAAQPIAAVNKELDAIRLNLQPIAAMEKTAAAAVPPSAVGDDAGPVVGRRRSNSNRLPEEEEEGIKRISEAAILNIRKEAANVINFNFQKEVAAGGVVKSHLPGVPAEYRPPQTAKQACSNRHRVVDNLNYGHFQVGTTYS